MDKIMQTFKEYDLGVLIAKKKVVSEELQKNKDLHQKLINLLERIEKAIEELKNTSYDSD